MRARFWPPFLLTTAATSGLALSAAWLAFRLFAA